MFFNGLLGGVKGLSSPLVQTEWGLIASQHGTFHYYAQDQVGAAVKDAIRIATEIQVPDENGNCFNTIVVIGYSNGGRSAIQFSESLRNKKIKVDLGFTTDPVPKGLELVPPFTFLPEIFLKKPSNTNAWVNFYQTVDKNTLLGLFGIKGHPIGGATNTIIHYDPPLNEKAHINIMLDPIVKSALDNELQSVPEMRASWKSTP